MWNMFYKNWIFKNPVHWKNHHWHFFSNNSSILKQWLTLYCFLDFSFFYFSHVFSRGHAILHLAVSVGRSVGRSVTFLNSERFWHYCSCPTVRDWIAVYPALFLIYIILQFFISKVILQIKWFFKRKIVLHKNSQKGNNRGQCHNFFSTREPDLPPH